MRVFRRIISDDDAGTLNCAGFKVTEEIIFITFVDRGNAVVTWKLDQIFPIRDTDERLCEYKDLTPV